MNPRTLSVSLLETVCSVSVGIVVDAMIGNALPDISDDKSALSRNGTKVAYRVGAFLISAYVSEKVAKYAVKKIVKPIIKRVKNIVEAFKNAERPTLTLVTES